MFVNSNFSDNYKLQLPKLYMIVRRKWWRYENKKMDKNKGLT